ncbi:hypothetical protein ACHWQZ_G000494 [Mnemiopsis leidyi]
MKDKTGIKVAYPDSTGNSGTTTTGNVARRLLYEKDVGELLLELIENEGRRDMMRVIMKKIEKIRENMTTSPHIDLCDPSEDQKPINLLHQFEPATIDECPNQYAYKKNHSTETLMITRISPVIPDRRAIYFHPAGAVKILFEYDEE